MDEQLLSNFRFLDYKFENLELVLNNEYQEESDISERPLSVTVGLEVNLSQNFQKAMVKIDFGVFKDAEANYPYKIDVSMIGYFELLSEATEEQITSLCKINGTAIMFPYIRSAITDLTKISNVEPLILPAINIHKLIERQERKYNE